MALLYFPLRARAEPLRMLFRHARLHITDEIVPLTAWSQLKSTMPKQKLPVLRLEDGTLLPETADIAMHAAKLHGPPLMPTGSREAALSAEECWREAGNSAVPYLTAPWADSTPWDARIGACNPLLNMLAEDEALPLIPRYLDGARSWMSGLADRLDTGRAPFMGGAEPHHGDFVSFHYANQITTLDGGAALAACELKVQLWYHSVSFLPAVAEYLATRPQAGKGEVGMPGSLLYERPNIAQVVRESGEE